MLSDEEKEAIKNLRLNVTNVGFSVYDGTTSLFKMRDIQIVLNLIDKKSKEIEELKEDRDEYKEEYIKLQNARYYNYISKDKIKAKIEEIKNECKYCDFTDEFCQELLQNNNCTQGNTLKVLQSLLEKE